MILIIQEAYWGCRWEPAGGYDFTRLYASQKSMSRVSLPLSIYMFVNVRLTVSIYVHMQAEVERFISAIIAGEFKFLRHLVSRTVIYCFHLLVYYINEP